ncbi:MAG: Ykud protein [Actinoallomurus sp.]|nr:Ykud protein [Actinoallomurus sp.]
MVTTQSPRALEPLLLPGPLGVLDKAGYFDGGHAIHDEPAVPLHPASHGCVRIPMSTSDIVAKLLPVGTRVYVRG